MFLSRMDYGCGIPVQHIPHNVLQKVELLLDIGTDHTWERLAECMDLDTVTILWIKSRSYRPARCLLEEHSGRVTVEQLIHWLEKIGNLAARDVLKEEYENINKGYQKYIDKFLHWNAAPKLETAKPRHDTSPVTHVCGSNEAAVQTDKKNRKLNIFLSCSSDGLKQCRRISRWLVKNSVNVVFSDEDNLMDMDLFRWAENQVKRADFIVFIISDGFCQDVQSSTTSDGDHCSLTHYVYRLMHNEYIHKHSHHRRSIPVLLPHTDCSNVPMWLKNTPLYIWPEHYKELFEIFYNFHKKTVK